MSEKSEGLLNKDELIKSLQDLSFSEEEIQSVIEKAEAEGKLSDKEVVDDPEDYDKEEMKKAYDKVMSMKDDLDKSIASFTDKYGSMPAFTKPVTEPVTKSVETDIEKAEPKEIVKSFDEDILKSFTDNISKSFGDKVDEISKSINSKFDEFNKSIEEINSKVEEIASAPNPLKSLLGNYQKSVIEKGVNEDGKTVLNLKRNKNAVIDVFEKSIDKITEEKDKEVVRNMISSYTISGITSDTGLDIVKKALDIDFEK